MYSANTREAALGTVRYELDALAKSRLLGPLGAVDEERYVDLCTCERRLLNGETMVEAAPVMGRSLLSLPG
jgi:hypothetical protein